jgi:diaminopimelate epimerase
MKVLVGDGCGNRFALIDAGAMTAAELSPGLVLHQCRDIDIDGLLVLDGVKLSIYNADGSEGVFEMAGHQIAWSKVGDDIELELPYASSDFEYGSLAIDGIEVSTINFSNPHAVVKNYSGYEQEFAEKLQSDSENFPQSVNVEFAKFPYENGEISARIFERGVGETLACGTGAVALAVDAWNSGFEGEITVKTWGGSLFLSKLENGKICLRGAARLTGNIDLELV